MKQYRPYWYVYLLFLLSISILPTTDAKSSNSSDFTSKPLSHHPMKIRNTAAEHLDSIIQKYAFKVLSSRRTKTGVVYDVPLPANLSGIHSSATRVRGRTLWLNGLTIGSFHIPPRTISIPPARRLIVVYQNLGNWSESYYKVQNYTLATPVLGLSTYDGNDTKIELGMRGIGTSIVVSFSKALNLSKNAKCMTFGEKGSQRLDRVFGNNTCLSTSEGHFSIVVPNNLEPPNNVEPVPSFERKMEKMMKRGEEDEVLDVVWVNGRKMPNASMMRTQPVLENGFVP